MQFTDTHTRERHEAEASAKITDAEIMYDATTRWSKATGRYEIEQAPFRPERARFRWSWHSDLGWVLTQINVSGYAINKNGTPGLKSRTVDFIRKGEVIPETPSALIELAEELAPKSKVIEP